MSPYAEAPPAAVSHARLDALELLLHLLLALLYGRHHAPDLVRFHRERLRRVTQACEGEYIRFNHMKSSYKRDYTPESEGTTPRGAHLATLQFQMRLHVPHLA